MTPEDTEVHREKPLMACVVKPSALRLFCAGINI